MHFDKLEHVVLGILKKDHKVLLVKRKKIEVGTDGSVLLWGFPGGKVDAGETREDAVVREIHEETGYHAQVDKLISKRMHPHFPVKVHYFACGLTKDTPDVVNDASTEEIAWVPLDELQTYLKTELDPEVQKDLFADQPSLIKIAKKLNFNHLT